MLEQVGECGDGRVRPTETFEVFTPIGKMIIKACVRGLHLLCQSPDINDSNFAPDSGSCVRFLGSLPQETSLSSKHVQDTVEWLRTYFHDLKKVSHNIHPILCCLNENGSFQQRVLFTLLNNVYWGQVISYSELASMAGSQGAQQSVGTAMAKNPFQLIVPCHRVVKQGKKVGKYSSGCRNSVKIWLLQHEGLIVRDDGVITSQ